MNIDYGARIRAFCDHLETVDEHRFKYTWSPLVAREKGLGIGCPLYHGIEGGVIPESKATFCREFDDEAVQWLGFDRFEGIFCDLVNVTSQKEKSISNLRAYADKHYPIVTQHHTGIPSSVLQIFKEAVAA